MSDPKEMSDEAIDGDDVKEAADRKDDVFHSFELLHEEGLSNRTNGPYHS